MSLPSFERTPNPCPYILDDITNLGLHLVSIARMPIATPTGLPPTDLIVRSVSSQVEDQSHHLYFHREALMVQTFHSTITPEILQKTD